MATTHSHNSIWIDTNNSLSVRPITEKYVPTGSQILIEVSHSGINPADIKHGFALGLNDYPSGYEYSGIVLSTGPDAKFSVGEKVLGHNNVGKFKPISHGSHQDYMIGEHTISRVPEGMPMQDAACICVMTQTAADALFNLITLKGGEILNEEPAGGSILIWGGASSVGIAAIQEAKVAGVKGIFVTASKQNHEVLRELGATACFDYRDADVVEQIKEALKRNEPLLGIFDTVASSGPDSTIAKCQEVAEGLDIPLVAVLPQPGNSRWKMVLPIRDVDVPITKPDGSVFILKANMVWQGKINSTLDWALAHYGKGKGFIIPNVRVFNGAEEGMEAMKNSAAGKAKLEKFAIKHPL